MSIDLCALRVRLKVSHVFLNTGGSEENLARKDTARMGRRQRRPGEKSNDIVYNSYV